MKQVMFRKMRVVKELEKEKIRKGEKFLYGDSMVAQIQMKQPGQQISYFECIKADEEGKNIEYMLVTNQLEEE